MKELTVGYHYRFVHNGVYYEAQLMEMKNGLCRWCDVKVSTPFPKDAELATGPNVIKVGNFITAPNVSEPPKVCDQK